MQHGDQLKAVKIHQPCPDCGSTDALTINSDGSTKCYACDTFTPSRNKKQRSVVLDKTPSSLYYTGEFLPLKERRIKQETAAFYKVKTDNKGSICYPLYNKQGEVVASKIRKSITDKEFKITGDFKNSTLFGQQLFGDGGKYITVVEGQDDAMALYQALGSKWPVVSVHSASSAVKDITSNLDFLESYENVVICFDADEQGKKAAQKVAEKLSPNKAKLVHLNRFKDASDYVINGGTDALRTEWWNQKSFTPAGVVNFADSFDAYQATVTAKLFPLPKSFGKLESMLKGGIASGEITTIGALTSIGKTTFINNLVYSFLEESDVRVGYLGLETTVGEIVKSMMTLHANGKELDNAAGVFDSITWKDRFFILDHLGSLDLDQMISRMRSMIIAFDLDIFILDPIQQALPDLSNDAVKELMDKLLKLAKQTGVSLVLVSHMRKPPNDKPHDVSEYDLLGSSAINQVSFNTILLSRDKMGQTDEIKSSTKMQMVKCRRTGQTGEAGWLLYNPNTGRLEDGEDPYNSLDDFE